MSERSWQDPDGHVSISVLMLHLDGELVSDKDGIAKHLQQCWTCRERLSWLNRGVLTFLDYHRHVLSPSVPAVEADADTWIAIQRELTRPAPDTKVRALWRRIANAAARVPVPAWVTTIASVGLFAALSYLWVVEPARLTAKEFLQRVCAVSNTQKNVGNPATHKLVRIRRGKRVFNHAANSADLQKAYIEKPDPDTLAALKLAYVNWERPLNALDFAAWHKAVVDPRDVIRESEDSITLETTLNGITGVRFVSFTVSRADWHPISHHIEFFNQPEIDIDELAAAPDPPVVTARTHTVSHISVASAHEPSGPTTEQLDDTEVRLREILHDLQADFYAAPQIRREPKQISLVAFVPSETQRGEILDAIQGIPFVAERIVAPNPTNPTPHESTSNTPTPNAVDPVQPAPVQTATLQAPPKRAPLADNLRRYCGGLEEANSYLAVLTGSHSETLMAASALRSLADRYSVSDWSRLSPDLQARLGRLTDDYESRLLRSARSYDALASPVLDAMLRDLNISPTVSDRPSTCCLSWREESSSISEQVQHIQSILTKLFAGTDSDRTGNELPVRTLLVQCDRARAELKWWLHVSPGANSPPGHVP